MSSSSAIEFEAFKRSMMFMLTNVKCGMSTFVSDRHSSIVKHMREVFTDIDHYFDVWHLAKSKLHRFMTGHSL